MADGQQDVAQNDDGNQQQDMGGAGIDGMEGGEGNQMEGPVDQEAAPMQFTDEEIQNLKEIFDLFDKDRKGSIEIKDLEAIMQSLQRDPAEAMSLLG